MKKWIALLLILAMTLTVSPALAAEETPAVPKSIKILAIGNSFAMDAMEHLWHICSSAGIKEVYLGYLFYPSASLDFHYNNTRTEALGYDYYTNSAGTWKAEKGSIKKALSDADWDYVTIQQQSIQAGKPDSFKNLQKILDYIQQHKTNPDAKIFWHMTWAYDASLYNQDFKAAYNNDTQTMYDAVINVARGLLDQYPDLAGIIPNGTMVQNLRTSSMKDSLTRDGYHLSLGAGRYAAAMTYFHAITGISPDQVTWVPKEYSSISFVRKRINQAVVNAVNQPYAVTSFAK